MSDENKFNPGNHVTWTSQAGGHAKTKTGLIVEVVPAHWPVGQAKIIDDDGFTVRADLFATRSHESYLVQVGKSKRLYWPLVKYLKRDT
jgi:hypothetical protein